MLRGEPAPDVVRRIDELLENAGLRPLSVEATQRQPCPRDDPPDRTPVAEEGPRDIRQLTAALNRMPGRVVTMFDGTDRGLGDSPALARKGRNVEPPQRVALSAPAEALAADCAAMSAPVTFVERGLRLIGSARSQTIRRTILNPIENAPKYGSSVTASCRAEEGWAVLRVEEEGPGIDPVQIDAMPYPVTRLEESRNRDTGGSDPGRALVKAIVDEDGGLPGLSSRPQGRLCSEIRFLRA